VARERVVLHRDMREVAYSPERFEVLASKRARSSNYLEALPPGTRVFGSLARGDVRPASDIDVEVPFGSASFAVEVALSRLANPWNDRRLVQATPNSVVKALWIFGEVTVALPITRPNPTEEDFARFGGAVDREQLRRNDRVPGVDKRLLLIEPTQRGHRESSVADRVEDAAKVLGIAPDVIRGRVRVLKRRSETGRTGVYLSRAVRDDQNTEEVLDELKDADPAVRRAASG